MLKTWPVRRVWQLSAAVVCLGAASFVGIRAVHAYADPAVIKITPPNEIKWVEGAGGAANAILAGDPSKPGLYVELIRWHPGHGSRPHSHPNDRFIYVISGTWYVGTGANYDPDHMVAMPAGTSITHFGKQIHYDMAKDEEALIELVGEGPATTTSAEAKK